MNNIAKIVLSIDKLAFFKVKHNDKRPATQNGYHDGKPGFDVARTLGSGFNVGFVMEPDFICLDMDEDIEKGYAGIKVVENLEKELGQLPQTYTQRTPRGGLHKVFWVKGLNSKPKGKITPAVDVKYSGYILFHGSSINGRYYQAIDGISDDGKLIFSALPQRWIDFIEISTPKLKSSKTNKLEYKPVVIEGDFKQMYDNCLFVRRCVELSHNLSEPEWHMFARLLNGLSNGEELFLEYSKNHSGFNPEQARKKFLYAKRYPVTCRTINEVSEACKDCYNITI